MKTSHFFGQILSICMIAAASSCIMPADAGHPKTITIPVERDYSELSVSSAISVTWSDTASALHLTAGEKIIDRVLVERTGQKLKIYIKTPVNTNGSIEVVLPSSDRLEEVSLSGASSFTSEILLRAPGMELDLSGASVFKADLDIAGKLEADCSGASSVKGNVKAGSLSLDLSGASSAKLSGEAGKTDLEISGASSLNALSIPLVTSDTDCEISGASHARIHCTGILTGELSGASSLRYGNGALAVRVSCTGASSLME